jgi:hypothetical protein
MKSIRFKSPHSILLTALLSAAGLATSHAASTLVTFSVDMSTNIANGNFNPASDHAEAHGTFNAWGALTLVQQGTSTIYTNTANDTTDANGGKMLYKFVINGSNWETPASSQNRAVLLPVTSGASLVLPTAFFADAGAPVTNNVTFQVDLSQQIALGNFNPATDQAVVRGIFNNWSGTDLALTNNPNIARTNQFGLVTSNVWVGTFPISGSPGGAEVFKYVLATTSSGDHWESPSAVNSDDGGNRYFANVAQTLPAVDFADAPYAPISTLTFNVDISVVVLTDPNFNPGSVTMWGDFNGWSAAVPMTNDPAAANTNIYTVSAPITSGNGSTINFQFRYTQFGTGNTVYDHLNGANGGSGNHQYFVVGSTNVPAIMFNDAELSDYLTHPTPVFFSVDMTGAVGTDSHPFNPSQDNLYINGQFANWYAWAGGINPSPAPAGYQMIEQGLGNIYTNTIIMPAGTPVSFEYKYGMDENAINGGPADNEAGFAQNHFRVVRSSAMNPYTMPTDKFGSPYREPFFNSGNPSAAQLTAGAASNGTVPITWLGRPGARLQVATSINGTWQDVFASDGTNWISGFNNPTNGFVSQTNWPVSGNALFRVIKP